MSAKASAIPAGVVIVSHSFRGWRSFLAQPPANGWHPFGMTQDIQSSARFVIDGDRLADLMIKHNIGVSCSHAYEVKHIDGDYFEES